VTLASEILIQLVDEVQLLAIQLLEANPLRASGAIHVASALLWRADAFVSSDARQCAAAKASGLIVIRL
jgi:hypothetical protein